MNNFPAQESCPCGSGETFSDCCKPYLTDQLWPRTAEKLMRSRYTAYALHNAPYLLKTWAKTTRPGDFSFENGLQWQKLDIIATHKGQIRDSRGQVHFKAYYQDEEAGEQGILEEVSDFKKDAARHWMYVSGKIL